MKNLYSKLGKLSKITLVIYCITFFFTSFVITMGFANYERDKERIDAEINDFNSALNYYGKDNIKKEQPMFDNSKSALDFAYNNFFSTPKKEIEIKGDTTIYVNIPMINITIPVKMYEKVTYYEDGDVFVTQGIYQEGDPYGQNAVKQRLYRKDGKVFFRKIVDITYDEASGVISPNTVDGKFEYEKQAQFCLYNFRKDNIVKDLGFSTKYNAYTGKVDSYSASAKLNVVTAVKGYAEQCQLEGELDKPLVFTDLETHFSLNSKGELVRGTVYEEYSSQKSLMGITAPYKSSSKFQITFKTDFDEYSQQKPIINL